MERPIPPETPMCERWGDWHEHFSWVQDFMEWLGGKDIVLAQYLQYPEEHPMHPGWYENPVPVMRPLLDLYYEYCEVDKEELERERRALLDYMRELNNMSPPPDRYAGLRVYDYLGMTEEEFDNIRRNGICTHPSCDRETNRGYSLCRWHLGSYHRWYNKKERQKEDEGKLSPSLVGWDEMEGRRFEE